MLTKRDDKDPNIAFYYDTLSVAYYNLENYSVALDFSNLSINLDSNKDGLSIFLNNKTNPWILIDNQNGTKNKITNNINKEPLKGFYIYRHV